MKKTSFAFLISLPLIVLACSPQAVVRSSKDLDLLNTANTIIVKKEISNKVSLFYDKGISRVLYKLGNKEESYKIKLLSSNMSIKATQSTSPNPSVMSSPSSSPKPSTSPSVTISSSPSSTPSPSPTILSPLAQSNVKKLKTLVNVDNILVEIDIDPWRISDDLSHTINLLGLSDNSKVNIKVSSYDSNNKVLQSKSLEHIVKDYLQNKEIDLLLN